jgi:cytochrome P450
LLAPNVKSRRRPLSHPWGQCIWVNYYITESGAWGLRALSAGLDTVRILDISAGFLPTSTMKTVSSMSSLFLALVLFPHVQKQAQAELDVVVGRDRLPTFDDRPRLPYIEALCKELMRWNMVTPIGMI